MHMSCHQIVAQRLAVLLVATGFETKSQSPYSNASGRRGQRLVGEMNGTPILFSESNTSTPLTPEHFARVLAEPDWLDERKTIVYWSRRRSGIGIRIEAWSRGRWYQVFIPVSGAESLDP